MFLLHSNSSCPLGESGSVLAAQRRNQKNHAIPELTKQRPFCPKGIIPVTATIFCTPLVWTRGMVLGDLPPPYDGENGNNQLSPLARLGAFDDRLKLAVNRRPFPCPDNG